MSTCISAVDDDGQFEADICEVLDEIHKSFDPIPKEKQAFAFEMG
jgi:hypothetical protein